MSSGRVTLPIEEGREDLVKELINLWKTDSIRNSDGTSLNDFFENLDQTVYATYFVARGDEVWANENPSEIINAVLMSEKNISFDKELRIDLLKGYYKEQLSINESPLALNLLQVIDRTSNRILDKEEYYYDNKHIIIPNSIKFHEYTVNFLAKQVWDITHMYNHLTNNWTGSKSTPIDVIYPRTEKRMEQNLINWLDL